MPAVRMNVVDAQDDSPLAGVLVLFRASASEGTWTGHGGRSVNLFVAEAVTSDAGDVHLPKQEFSAQPFFLNTNHDNPSMVMFKAGYVLVVLHNMQQDVSTWQYNNQTIKMRRATTDDETFHALHFAADYAYRATGICSWKKIPSFLVTVDRSAAEWNRKRASLPDEVLRRRTVTSPLERVLMNDGYYVEKGCGSPRTFFELHRR